MDVLNVIVGAAAAIPIFYGLNTINPSGASNITQGLNVTINDIIMLVGSALAAMFGGNISTLVSKAGLGAVVAIAALIVVRNYPTGSNTGAGAVTTPQPVGM